MTKNDIRITMLLLFIAMFSGCYIAVPGGRIVSPARPPAQLAPSYEKQTPPPWAPAHGQRAKNVYRYYPSNSVYFDTGRGLYFYYRNGSWTASASLPGGLRISVNDYVTLDMDTDRPYTYHGDVQKRYPPGQMKKKDKEKDKRGKKNKYENRYKQRDKHEDRDQDRYEDR